MAGRLPLAVAPESAHYSDAAARLAQSLNLPLLPVVASPSHCDEARLLLWVGAGALRLQQCGRGAPGPVVVDFGAGSMRHRRRGGHNEALGRAVGVGRGDLLTVLDATAGLGRDGFVLADLGCRVRLCERHPVIAALLRSGLEQASAGDAWLAAVAGRIQLFEADARKLQGNSLAGLDVIYLDPMFPARQKSAAVKKEMALFQALLGEERSDDGPQLLEWALQQTVARVVVKRPAKAGPLAGRKPSHSISGKAVRFDVYVQRGFDATVSAGAHVR